jgi:hypothetical protein
MFGKIHARSMPMCKLSRKCQHHFATLNTVLALLFLPPSLSGGLISLRLKRISSTLELSSWQHSLGFLGTTACQALPLACLPETSLDSWPALPTRVGGASYLPTVRSRGRDSGPPPSHLPNGQRSLVELLFVGKMPRCLCNLGAAATV